MATNVAGIKLVLNGKYQHLLAVVFIIILTLEYGESYTDNDDLSPYNYLSQSHGYFVTHNNTKITAQRGGMAFLPCTVKLTSPATVSWVRRQDFQTLLTVGLSTYSGDDRYLVEHARHAGHWSLRIKSVRDDDAGIYECQLSVYPVQSIFIELQVVEAVAEIIGAPDLHIDEGSTLRLECRLKRATENPTYVFWYHDDTMVNYDQENGFSVSLLPTTSSSSVNSKLHHLSAINSLELDKLPILTDNGLLHAELATPSTSVLTIREVNLKHAGNYTCAPSNTKSASITVHVLRGERPAAMQHANRSIDAVKSESSPSTVIVNLFHTILLSLFPILIQLISS